MISRCSGLSRQPPATNSARQPVEQLGMRRGLAEPAEVARGGHEALAEVVLPDPVDDHAGRERIVGPAQPAGQGEPPAGRARRGRRGGSILRRSGIEDREEARRDRIGLAAARDHGRRGDRSDVGRPSAPAAERPAAGRSSRAQLLLQLVPTGLLRSLERGLAIVLEGRPGGRPGQASWISSGVRSCSGLRRMAWMSSGNLAIAPWAALFAMRLLRARRSGGGGRPWPAPRRRACAR